MDDCTRFFNQIADLRLGELDDDHQSGLFTHLAACRECRELMRFHDDLADAGNEFADVGAGALAAMRERVLDEIRSEGAADLPTKTRAVIDFPARFRVMAAAAAVLLAVGSFAVGRSASRPVPAQREFLVTTLESSAQDHHRLRDVEDSPNVISNVAVRRVDGGRVAMSFDVARHLEIVRPIGDPLVNEILVHAMLDQSSVGSRLKAVSMAAASENGKVEEALVFSMLEDRELAVRMRALEILADRPVSSAVQQGLMRVLRHDESMQMRLLAIEILGNGGPGGRRILEGFLETDEAVEPAIAERLASFIQS